MAKASLNIQRPKTAVKESSLSTTVSVPVGKNQAPFPYLCNNRVGIRLKVIFCHIFYLYVFKMFFFVCRPMTRLFLHFSRHIQIHQKSLQRWGRQRNRLARMRYPSRWMYPRINWLYAVCLPSRTPSQRLPCLAIFISLSSLSHPLSRSTSCRFFFFSKVRGST